MERSDIRKQVEEFMIAGGQDVKSFPEAPSDAVVRLRACLIVEETYELLDALFDAEEIKYMKKGVLNMLRENFPVKVDMVEFADACADIDYVVEGARLAFGINGKPIADEVQRSNMAKFGPGSWKDENGKIRKPPDWTAPDIKTELILQGWKPLIVIEEDK